MKYHRIKIIIGLSVIVLLLQGCAANKEMAHAPLQPLKTLTATGFGTSVDKQLQPAQRRLMGMRASKMEAYRDMAEQLYGVNLNGRTSVEQMVVKNDDYRTFIDHIVRGARVKSIKAIDVDTYETVMEVDLTPRFFECVNGSEAVINECIKAAQGFSLASVPSSASASAKPVNLSCNSEDCYAYPKAQGFATPKNRPNYVVEMVQETSKQLTSTPAQVYDAMFGAAPRRPL